ncbi:hypothetical protein GCM10010984_17070 [Chishuiella changwenlii]|uniref:Uncharacterized protein n=1 Tax=Chishuiella changwenlii TaxID=1434701 RepID=A0ABQ1TPS5_9FLAO|nr:hypothetical protein GCM10010984_17070 [Chishuiella changwenlii]
MRNNKHLFNNRLGIKIKEQTRNFIFFLNTFVITNLQKAYEKNFIYYITSRDGNDFCICTE